jgi:outer membrane protein assembly factor BamA
MAFGTYSDTDSWFAGVFGDVHWGDGDHQLSVGGVQGTIRNEYEDFLGTGFPVQTTDDIEALFLRYKRRVYGNWLLGGQLISSNYAIGADGLIGDILEQIGLVGFDSVGVGAVLEYDSRDSQRNPTVGQRLIVNNIAYRERLGGDDSFDTLTSDYTHYRPFGDGHVLAVQVHGRWTQDAPLGGFSSVTLRGYTRGNYLAEHYTHVDVDARFKLRGKFGAAVFAGVGCLYGGVSDCGDGEALYPAAGVGLIYTLRPEAGFVVRADFAVGDGDNSAFYIRLGQPF